MLQLKRIGVMVAAFGVLMAMGTRAEATPITGSVTFGGVIADTNFLTTNSIDVVNETAVVTCAQLGLCDGSYAPLNLNFVNGTVLNAQYKDFTFNPLPGGGYNPLWSFNYSGTAYAFNLLNITSIERSVNGILLTGTGLATITGFDNTAATWSFSADKTGRFAFSSTTTAVPDAGTTGVLLGMAVLSLAMVRRRVSLVS